MIKKKKEPYPVFNQLECKACERCIIACRQGVLKMSDDINERGYHYAEYVGSGCNGCGDCYYTCPEPLAVEVHIPLRKKVKVNTNLNKGEKEKNE
ncbi:MAG TPA: ferredoxin family protein [Methanothermobacter sp.]|nr:ferredoxin family protein [Methanothermobacter sp.]